MSEQSNNPLPIAADDPEPDSNQLAPEDTLDTNPADDLQGEAYELPDHPRFGLYNETALDQSRGMPISRELAAEEPEVWDVPEKLETEDSVGQLVADAEALDGRGNDIFAADDDSAGIPQSAEEAAVHIVTDQD